MQKRKYYPEPVQNLEFSELEESVLKFWEENKVFEESIRIREAPKKMGGDKKVCKEFVFYDGPPFATGLPHYGHLLAGYIKDTVARYKTMQGYKVERRFGWDCHGLPAEMGVEKQIKISGRKAIEEYGIAKFNEVCRNFVQTYVNEWKYYVNRSGRWVDFDGGYKTMDLDYMESVMWVFKQLYDKELLYEDYRVMPYSWSCQTPLSNFETKQDNSYRQRADKAITVKFELARDFEGKSGVKILAWTTTPWTLPSNLALAVAKDVDYVLVEKHKENLIICKKLLPKYAKELSTNGEKFNILSEFKGKNLLGLGYKPLFPFLLNNPQVKESNKCFTILDGDFVTTNEGTGVVHIAPGFGEDDQRLCKDVGIPTICPVDDAGKFTSEILDYKGKQVFETNDPIIIRLKEEGKWLKTEQYLPDYPHCWRTDEPLIYKAMSSWYVKVSAIKENMLKSNEKITWMPEHVKHGRFGKWLEGAMDWSITRNRFWGCPVPVWKSDNPKYPRIDVYGSLDELQRDFGVRPKDLHRPYIDELVRKNPDDPTGKSMMRRVTDVLDCWFESGSMPYAQFHYPFERKDWFNSHFPADFITEGDGQLRGWFYVLVVLGAALFDKPAFKNCLSYGVIVDETGKKLSKRLKNYVDVDIAFKTFGSDAIRWMMLKSPVLRGEEMRVDKDGKDMKENLRLAIKPILNAYNFFCLYANSDKIKAEKSFESEDLMDRYILAKLKDAVEYIEQEMNGYNLGNACRKSEEFFEILNNWYIRRNKNRFWKSKLDLDKRQAYNTLYTVLTTMCETIASLMPFTSEFVWRGLTI
jgi:isoleucyl-tRNA synthetase